MPKRVDHSRTVIRSILIVVGMFGFGFALVPMYTLLCELTGLGGKTSSVAYQYDPANVAPDTSRLVQVAFLTNNNDGMPWQFEAVSTSVRVHPGELKEVMFKVRNPTTRVITGQAIPSLAPGRVVDFFHKTECFCFRQQTLGPGEELLMPMRFVVDPALPKGVDSIQLAYTLYDVTEFAQRGSGNRLAAGG